VLGDHGYTGPLLRDGVLFPNPSVAVVSIGAGVGMPRLLPLRRHRPLPSLGHAGAQSGGFRVRFDP